MHRILEKKPVPRIKKKRKKTSNFIPAYQNNLKAPHVCKFKDACETENLYFRLCNALLYILLTRLGMRILD